MRQRLKKEAADAPEFKPRKADKARAPNADEQPPKPPVAKAPRARKTDAKDKRSASPKKARGALGESGGGGGEGRQAVPGPDTPVLLTPVPPAPEATFECPFCGDVYAERELVEHLPTVHAGDDASQVCPICAAGPGGDPNYVSQNIFGHFAARHGARGPRLTQSREREAPRIINTCHAVPSTSAIFSRGIDFVWEYAWRVDNGQGGMVRVPCASCEGSLALSEPRAILPCGCSFHAGCIEQDTSTPACPRCDIRDL